MGQRRNTDGMERRVPKKRDLQECKNYRGIILLSVPGKILNRIILDRLKTVLDARLRDNQADFRKDKLCTDQIATLRTIVEQSMEWDSFLYINFLNSEKAFDNIDWETQWKLLRHYGIPEKNYPKYLRRHGMQGYSCRTNDSLVYGEDRSDALYHLSSSCWP